MIEPKRAYWADRSDRVRLVLTGADRKKFLHNYCTNDVKRLASGQGCEAFVTSLQGKTLSWFSVHDRGPDLLIRSDPGGFELASPHFAKYAVFDDVEFRDVAPETNEYHLAGGDFEAILARAFGPNSLPGAEELSVKVQADARGEVTMIRESPLGISGMTVIGVSNLRGLESELAGWRALNPDEAEGLRIEAGTPRFGPDVTPENLPQEVARDARAISFVKGCYLGQETVARLDALGHVNKILSRVIEIEGPPPPAGSLLSAGGTAAGSITSSGRSPRDGRSHAIAMVRVKAAPPGTVVTWDGGEGRIAELAPS